MSSIKVYGDGSSTIYQLLNGNVPSPACGGNGTCGKCRVRPKGDVSPPSSSEVLLLSREVLASGTRLACLCVPRGECVIDMQDVAEPFGIVSAYDVPPFAFRGEGYGVAVDIGTTTCVMDLIDLATGQVLARESFLNAQRSWGADVLSRVQASVTGHAEDLRSAILSGLGEGLERLLARTVVTAGTVATVIPSRMVISANTAMCHFLLGLDALGLGTSPFTPEATEYPDRTLAELFGTFLFDARLSSCVVQIIPGVSAFIGGDIVAGLASLELGEAELFIDIGTNAEIVLSVGGKYICSSAAAGPAFEGGGISCGTGCVSGAVSAVYLEKNKFGFTLIGGARDADTPGASKQNASGHDADTPGASMQEAGNRGAGRTVPAGLCGSGLLDLIACSLKLGLIRSDGSLSPVCADKGIFLEVAGTIILTQKDIREFQLAKAAVCAGIEVLLSQANVSAENIARVHLSGGFAQGLSEQSAIAVGLLPPSFAGRIHRAGNTSLAGAARYLADSSLFARFDGIMHKSVTVQLASDVTFNSRFVDAMNFPIIKDGYV